MGYSITFPYYYKIVVYLNGMRFFLSDIANMRCSMERCVYVFDEGVIDKLNTSNCSVRVVKYYTRYTVELSYTCNEFIKLLKELNE
jgi:hypothetical protein